MTFTTVGKPAFFQLFVKGVTVMWYREKYIVKDTETPNFFTDSSLNRTQCSVNCCSHKNFVFCITVHSDCKQQASVACYSLIAVLSKWCSNVQGHQCCHKLLYNKTIIIILRFITFQFIQCTVRNHGNGTHKNCRCSSLPGMSIWSRQTILLCSRSVMWTWGTWGWNAGSSHCFPGVVAWHSGKRSKHLRRPKWGTLRESGYTFTKKR